MIGKKEGFYKFLTVGIRRMGEIIGCLEVF